jgi:PhzF family phenazine biosynthesis protein
MARPFRQVDVFSPVPYAGNPVAVVLDSDGLAAETMARFAAWTNLSESTFVGTPTTPAADYRVRIFDPGHELPFAGHPTLGSCHAWLEAGGRPKQDDVIVQECGAGLVEVRRTEHGLAFAAPPLIRDGPVEPAFVARIAEVLGIDRSAIVDARWADNGPGWVAVLLAGADAVLALEPTGVDFDLGVCGLYPPGGPVALEVRAFFPHNGATAEDPVTGSLNASLAGWLIETGRLEPPWVASQGTAMGRTGRVHVDRDDRGTIWVGGATVTAIRGEVEL